MSDGMDELKQQARAVVSAPIAFAATIVIVGALLWGFIHWSYRETLQTRDAHIASLQRRVDEYRDALGGASADEARRQIAALQAEVRTLRLRLAPRRLGVPQRQAIADRSRRPAGTPTRSLAILIESPCSDCTEFAAEIAEALRTENNWAVATETVGPSSERMAYGLTVRVADATRPDADAVVLQQALRSAGLAFSTVSGGPGATLSLLITDRAHP